jgi:hypothetical protein
MKRRLRFTRGRRESTGRKSRASRNIFRETWRMKFTISRIAATFFIVCCITTLIGCASIQPVPPNTPPITLDQSYTRKTERLISWNIVFPAGIYQADFQTDRGIYYLAPTSIICDGHSMRGGLLIPKSPDEKQAGWIEEGDTYHFSEPIPYH